MKKIILALSAIALVVSCSQSRKWTDKERDEVRKVVRDRHDRSAIRHMEAKNYTNLEECVVTTIEEWPAEPGPLAAERLDLEPLGVGHAAEMARVLGDPALHDFTGGEPATGEDAPVGRSA